MLAPEIIRHKRDGRALGDDEIQAFVQGLTDGRWSEGQVAALAMAICLRGMDRRECVTLTSAMTHSGERLHWDAEALGGPVLDKHSTGGVGDKVSLLLAPLVAACGARVPMVSGRGLGHTGGTLDKLEALPGYRCVPEPAALQALLQRVGCAIVGASAHLAPADRRLYAIRDVTATVESVPLITASILSKKLAAGVQGLVMDVKVGQGAFCPTLDGARELARSLVEVAQGAGLPTTALLTDMNQVLGRSAGNALEVAESIAALKDPAACEARLREVTLALAAPLLVLGRLAPDEPQARQRLEAAWASGEAARRFAEMVAALGGPPDVLRDAALPRAPVCLPVEASADGRIAAVDVRALGLTVVELGGGRRHPDDRIDPRVGLDGVRGPGETVVRGEPLAWIHAADLDAARRAEAVVRAAYTWGEGAAAPLVHARIDAQPASRSSPVSGDGP